MSRVLSVLRSLGACALPIALFVGICVLFVGGAKVGSSIEPWVRFFSALAFLIVLPVSVLLLLFRKTRSWGGLGIYVVSWSLGIWLWLVAFLYAVAISIFWAVGGVLVAGLGVIPVAAIMSLLRRDWAMLGVIAVNGAIVIPLRWLGLWIVTRESERRDEITTQSQPEKLTYDDEFYGFVADEIMSSCGTHLRKLDGLANINSTIVIRSALKRGAQTAEEFSTAFREQGVNAEVAHAAGNVVAVHFQNPQ